MKTKKMLTANLRPGMIAFEDTYTSNNQLVIQSNTTLTPEIIDKLKYYAIRSIKVSIPEPGEEIPAPSQAEAPQTETPQAEAAPSADDTAAIVGPTYFERVQESAEFQTFRKNFASSIEAFKDQLNDIVTKTNVSEVVDSMLKEVDNIISGTRNALHLLDMLQCLRGFDDLTYAHSMNVALICDVIGSWINLSKEDRKTLLLAGLLHDIGKLKIPPEIIKKPGKLTDDEFAQIRSHPQLGYDILEHKNLDKRVKLAALQHHERFDGGGYPKHLTGPEISYFSAIVAIADVYEAMTANRVYRKGICPFKVIGMLEKEQNLYEPSILYMFMKRTIEAYINTDVLLSTGEKAKVVLLNQNIISRPIVITDVKAYDLSKEPGIEIETLI